MPGGAGYDLNGNQTALPSRSFTYDAANRLTSTVQPAMGAISYVYDGNGHRVQKNVTKGTTTVATTYVYDGGGQLTAEYAGASSVSGTLFQIGDMLGSTRLVLDVSGNVVERMDYLPFGEEIPAVNGGRGDGYSAGVYPGDPDVEALKFTGKERDAESGLDYFGTRYMSSAQGRFTSPDASGLVSVDPANPQSWNLYSYAWNNPLVLRDPTGLEPCSSDPSLADGAGGDAPGGCDMVPPPPSLPDQNCSGNDCKNDPVQDANLMGVALSVLSPSCLQSSLREVVASGETPGELNGGYGTVVRGQVISAPAQFAGLVGTTNAHISDPGALNGHPNILVQVNKSLKSTAFGRYQILNGSAQGRNMTDFSPAGQDAYANDLLARRGSVGAAGNGNFSTAMADAGREWASMPGSPYGQGGISLKTAATTFLQAVNSCH